MEVPRCHETHRDENEDEQNEWCPNPPRWPEVAEEAERDAPQEHSEKGEVHESERRPWEVEESSNSLEAALVAEAISDSCRRTVGEHVKEAEEDVDEDKRLVKNEHSRLLWRRDSDNLPRQGQGWRPNGLEMSRPASQG